MEDFEDLGNFTTLWVGINSSKGIGVLRLNRTSRNNAMTLAMVQELPSACGLLDSTESVRAIVLCAAGKHFCAGLDFEMMQSVTTELLGRQEVCPAQTRRSFLKLVKQMQVRLRCSSLNLCDCLDT
jgi:enoyl-CoA hydratase